MKICLNLKKKIFILSPTGKLFFLFTLMLFLCYVFLFTLFSLHYLGNNTASLSKDYNLASNLILKPENLFFEKDFSNYANLSDSNFYYVQKNGFLDTNKPVVYNFVAPQEYAFEIELKTKYNDQNSYFEECVNKYLLEKEEVCEIGEKISSFTKEECLFEFYVEAIFECRTSLELGEWQTSKIIFNMVDQFNYFYLIITPKGIIELNRAINGKIEHSLLYIQTDINNQEWNNVKIIKLKDEISVFVNDKYIETFYDFQEGFFDYKKDFFNGQSGIIAIESKECRTQIRKLNIFKKNY